jgi:hypothetical protein
LTERASFFVTEVAQSGDMPLGHGDQIPAIRRSPGGRMGVPGIDQVILEENTADSGISQRMLCADSAIDRNQAMVHALACRVREPPPCPTAAVRLRGGQGAERPRPGGDVPAGPSPRSSWTGVPVSHRLAGLGHHARYVLNVRRHAWSTRPDLGNLRHMNPQVAYGRAVPAGEGLP